ncbi:hypothetical protein L596_020197 [Steinernema carpocapsae]|uniref:Uncharacterized protein n=1 Tax=Steinernema carpocapsae TaxID=34508 RepID=A0A4V6A0T7_STECR|nr:hypothetical protein L596_020197 [Steinernema carpocapsae]
MWVDRRTRQMLGVSLTDPVSLPTAFLDAWVRCSTFDPPFFSFKSILRPLHFCLFPYPLMSSLSWKLSKAAVLPTLFQSPHERLQAEIKIHNKFERLFVIAPFALERPYGTRRRSSVDLLASGTNRCSCGPK